MAVLLLCASCGEADKPFIKKSHAHNGYTLNLYSPRVKGYCYAPTSTSTNGYLRIEGMHGRDEMAFAQPQESQIGRLKELLAKEPSVIDGNGVKLFVPDDALAEKRIDLQILAYKCGARDAKVFRSDNFLVWTISIDLANVS